MNTQLVTKEDFSVTATQTDIVERFLDLIDIKENSRATYCRALKQFFEYLKAEGITEPTRQTIKTWRDELLKTHRATTTQNYLTIVKRFFKTLAEYGEYENITANVRNVRITHEHKKDILLKPERNALLDAISQDSEQGIRDYALITLLLYTGIRTVEASRATESDFTKVQGNYVLYIQRKGHDEADEYVKLPLQVVQPLERYLNSKPHRGDTRPLFENISNRNKGGNLSTRTIRGLVKDYLRAAGLDSNKLTAHSLRHTNATVNILSGVPLDVIQRNLGHSNINTTMVYLHETDRANSPYEQLVADAML